MVYYDLFYLYNIIMGIADDLQKKIKSFNESVKKSMTQIKSTNSWQISRQMNAAIKSVSKPKPSIQSTIQSDVIATEKAFAKVTTSAVVLFNLYDVNLTNAKNLVDSYINYVKQNKDLQKQLDQMGGDIDTNDRKTDYQDQANDSLNYYYSWMIYSYVALVFVFVMCWILFPSLYSNTVKGLLFLFFATYPLFSTQLLKYIFYLYNNYLLELLPNKANSNI